MRLVIDDILPDPVVVPFGGSTQVQLKAHFENFEPRGDTSFRRRLLLRLIRVSRASTPPPVPWTSIILSPFFMDGVSVVNNGDGTYMVSHDGA